MLYYYANTGHKIGLERLRRGAALLNSLDSQGRETQFLVNDFRAGLIAKELGVSAYVTVEGVQDIDAIAEHGDSIIIDSSEDDHGRLVKYCEDFKNVWRFAHDEADTMIHDEVVLDMNTTFIDKIYFEETSKEERVLFFLGDADYDKVILNNSEFFKALDMELLLGNYFFVKYEDDLAKLFSTLHEPEEYNNIVRGSSTVVTASTQTALEVKASGGKSIYLNITNKPLYALDYLTTKGIPIIDGFNVSALQDVLMEDIDNTVNSIEKIDDKSITNKL